MSFQQALSGLNAASRGLEVIGNNIANANTTGAKASRVEFADVYAASMNAAGSSSMPLGVEIGAVSQSFTQGNITTTNNELDLAINGNGFFQITKTDGTSAYTRSGEFKVDKDGFVVTNNGAKLMGYKTDVDGVRTSTTPSTVQLPNTGPIEPKQTGVLVAELNLDACTPTATATTPLSQTSTSLMAYDSQGVEVPVSLSFVKTATPNTWEVYTSSGSGAPTKQGGLVFNTDGTIKETLDSGGVGTGKTTMDLPMTGSSGAVGTWNASVDFGTSTQLGTAFAVAKLSQDGWAPGELASVKIGNDGVISARYSNGKQQAVGQVMLANFRNPQGLTPLGAGAWAATSASGSSILGAPGEGNLGALQAGALEESNVDLTAELVNMMTSQRTYQANAQTIKTLDQILSTLVNMR
jgi:flagellar hook protein FlgE